VAAIPLTRKAAMFNCCHTGRSARSSSAIFVSKRTRGGAADVCPAVSVAFVLSAVSTVSIQLSSRDERRPNDRFGLAGLLRMSVAEAGEGVYRIIALRAIVRCVATKERSPPVGVDGGRHAERTPEAMGEMALAAEAGRERDCRRGFAALEQALRVPDAHALQV